MTLVLFVYWLTVLGLPCCLGFSLVVVSGGYLLGLARGLLFVVASLVVGRGHWGPQASVVGARRLSSCGFQAQEHRAQAQQMWHTDLVASWYVGSSWTRDQTHVFCSGGSFTAKALGKPQCDFRKNV